MKNRLLEFMPLRTGRPARDIIRVSLGDFSGTDSDGTAFHFAMEPIPGERDDEIRKRAMALAPRMFAAMMQRLKE